MSELERYLCPRCRTELRQGDDTGHILGPGEIEVETNLQHDTERCCAATEKLLADVERRLAEYDAEPSEAEQKRDLEIKQLADAVMRKGLGPEGWNKFWGPYLELLGAAYESVIGPIVEARDKATHLASEREADRNLAQKDAAEWQRQFGKGVEAEVRVGQLEARMRAATEILRTARDSKDCTCSNCVAIDGALAALATKGPGS